MSGEQISRRNALLAGGALAATALASGPVLAQSQAHDAHAHHMMGSMHKNQALIDTAMDCIVKGNLCLDHCMALIRANDTSIAACAQQVMLMLPMCDVLAKYAMADAPYLKQVANLCITICTDCEKECRKHEGKHSQCKACADSCAACIKACKALLAA
ncbi:MAG: four-helix bundle copper-binding protein [Alphaproteobacteria bacterium]|nr:four-helix bundle copper-binding protein [Alphaproteobacteria bacterium]